MTATFVGRGAEIDALIGLLSEAARASGAASGVVTAIPGAGKSRLLRELVGHVRDTHRIAWVVGYEPMREVPLGASGDLLRQLGLFAEDPGQLSGSDGPVRVFEAAHRARTATTLDLVIVDDLQWVDDLSLAMILYLLRAAEATATPLTVIAASRPAAAAVGLADALSALAPRERFVALELPPLAPREGLELMRMLAPHLDARRAAVLVDRAQGSPFWLEALAASGTGDTRDVITARLAATGGDPGALLAALVAAARPVAPRELAIALDWPEARIADASAVLVARGLALGTSGLLWLTHDLIREAALPEIPEGEVRRLHARFAAAIEADAAADLRLLREALEHRRAAGLPMRDLARRVLSAPDRRLLGGDGLQLLRTIVDGMDPSPERFAVQVLLARLATELGEQEASLELWATIAEHSPSADVRARADLAAAQAAFRLARATPAWEHVSRARAGAPAGQADLAIAIEAQEAVVQMWLRHDSLAGAAAAQRAIALARELAEDRGGVDRLDPDELDAYRAAFEAAADAATQGAQWDDLLEAGREIEALAELLDDAAYVDAITRLGSGLRQLDPSAEAERLLERAWLLAQERILPTAAAEAGQWYARVLADRGRLRDAHGVAVKTAELEQRLGHGSRQWGRVDALVHMLELYLDDPRSALAALRADADANPDRHHVLGIRQTVAEWEARFTGAAAADDIDRQLEDARAAAREVACPRCGHELAIVDAEIQARLGRPEEAQAKLAAWLAADAGRMGYELWRFRAETALLLARGDGEAAVRSARQSLDVARERHRATAELWAAIDLGRTLVRLDRGAAVRSFEEAATIAERMGASSIARLATSFLRQLGVRAWRRQSSGTTRISTADRLSAREREIARRIANGATNAEIAETLVISPRTVERHVTNILTKLGLRNRTELAAMVRGSANDGGDDAA